jgi:hypothetical protein
MDEHLGDGTAVRMQMAKPDLAMLLKDAPEGKWIALSLTLKRVVGIGDTVIEALAAAKANGELRPLVGKKPSSGPFVF